MIWPVALWSDISKVLRHEYSVYSRVFSTASIIIDDTWHSRGYLPSPRSAFLGRSLARAAERLKPTAAEARPTPPQHVKAGAGSERDV